MAEAPLPDPGPLPVVASAADLLRLALAASAQAGDDDPELIQHVVGTREELTRLTGSFVYSHEPSYLVAIRGNFSSRRVLPPGPEWDDRRGEVVSSSVKVLVVSIRSGQVTDSGGGHTYPDLSSVGPVVTDYRDSRRATAQRWRRLLLRARRRLVIARAKRIEVRQRPVALRYRGAITVGSSGRALLHGRNGGIGDLIWDGLRQAGWDDQADGPWPIISLLIRLPPRRVADSIEPRTPVFPGGRRRRTEPGQTEEDGTICYRYEGPAHPRAVTGRALVDSERRPEDFDSYEDLLYTAALQSGWLRGDQPEEQTEVPDVEIVVAISRPRKGKAERGQR